MGEARLQGRVECGSSSSNHCDAGMPTGQVPVSSRWLDNQPGVSLGSTEPYRITVKFTLGLGLISLNRL